MVETNKKPPKKGFIVTYESPGNIFKGKKLIKAIDIVAAQDIFLRWIKKQDVYQHLWNLSFQIEEVQL
jgi:hypothetical protein